MKIRQDLIIQDVGNEAIIFDPKTAEAHHLNEEATQVLKDCTAGAVPDSGPLLSTLELLRNKGFFIAEKESEEERLTRRRALQLVGTAAVLTIALPVPAAAMSGAGVTETDCIMAVPGACGQPCIGVIGTRVCGTTTVGGACACVPAIAAMCPCV